MNLLDELQQRGMLHSHTPQLPEALQKPLKGYLGIDPTAPSLHIGHLASLMLALHLQRAGHQPLLLLGGATGMIGDPSFKKQERQFLEEETLRAHQAALQEQIQQLFSTITSTPPRILNNYDWYKGMNVLDFLRHAGKHISLNYMTAKEAVKSRLTHGISYTEFSYPLLQAYDFYHLYQKHQVTLQIGGADQWGNITTGIDLIRKKTSATVHALTTPLITKADGTKFGKTEQGNIWLDPALTSPYQFYQFFLNTTDEEAPMLLKRLTFLPLSHIQETQRHHEQAPHKRLLQKELAKAVTTLIHAAATYEQVRQASDILFGTAPLEALETLPEKLLLDILQAMPRIAVSSEALQSTHTLTDLLTTATQHTIFPSKRAARDLITAGALRINKQKITDPNTLPPLTWIHNRYLLIQKGKKQYYLLDRSGEK